MKRFLVLTCGFVPPTDDIKQAWGHGLPPPGRSSPTRVAHSHAAASSARPEQDPFSSVTHVLR